MIKGLFTATSGMLVNQRKLNLTSNNLANVNTTGYKKDQGIQRSFKEVLVNRMDGNGRAVPLGENGSGVMLEESYTDYNQGNLRETGNQLDIAIEGSGFFVIQTENGIAYTRDGNFSLNNMGKIVTQQGYQVMGERGPLQTIQGNAINIDTNGQLYLGDIAGDRFQIVDISEPQLMEKMGDNLFRVEEEYIQESDNYLLEQGFLENSNVNIIQEMVKMIQLNRHFEANQKVITTVDGILDKAVNNIGRIG